jgi:hypothetical protein
VSWSFGVLPDGLELRGVVSPSWCALIDDFKARAVKGGAGRGGARVQAAPALPAPVRLLQRLLGGRAAGLPRSGRSGGWCRRVRRAGEQVGPVGGHASARSDLQRCDQFTLSQPRPSRP